MKVRARNRGKRDFAYPAKTEGSEIARRVRDEANTLTEAQREGLFKKGMRMIYGGCGAKEAVRSGR